MNTLVLEKEEALRAPLRESRRDGVWMRDLLEESLSGLVQDKHFQDPLPEGLHDFAFEIH